MSPLRRALVVVAALHCVLLFGWGAADPIYDEVGYLAAGEEVARFVRCTVGLVSGPDCAAAGPSSLGRLAWHNPGYAALFPIAALLPGPAALWIRLLQIAAGLIAGAATGALLRRWTSERVALVGALVVWLHPVQLFFRMTLWPVAVATGAAAVSALLVARLAERPGSEQRARQLGLAVVVLVFVWPPALALVPFGAVWAARLGRNGGHLLGPLLLTWLPWALLASLILGRPSAMDLAAAENTALGNNPWIADGRGSALHDPPAVQRLRFESAVGCPAEAGLERLRCRAARQDAISRRTMAEDPAGAAQRALLRFLETWRPDDFVDRHLADLRVWAKPPPAGIRAASGAAARLAEIGTLLAVLLACVGALRDRRVALLVGAAVLATTPVLLTVGLTRLRQPGLPWIVAAVLLTLPHLRRTYTRPR